MKKLLLTSNERELINQIQEEIEEMNNEVNELMEKYEKSTKKTEQESWLNAAVKKGKRMRKRSKNREYIIKAALKRSL